MKQLIVNADDLGWSDGVNRGILEAHRRGMVTSTSLLANGETFAVAVRLLQEAPHLGVGVHLNLSDGPPVLPRWEVASLVNPEGRFYGGPGGLLLRLLRGRVRLREAEREWDAQIEKVKRAGIAVTHLDGHKHVHMLPGLFDVALRLARRHGIRAMRVSIERCGAAAAPVRTLRAWKQRLQGRALALLALDAADRARRAGVVSPEFFCGLTDTGLLTRDALAAILKNLPEGATELMCHPGYADAGLQQTRTRLQGQRQLELEALTCPDNIKLLAEMRVELIDYIGLANHP